ncbi:hypothetical protein DPEC_G00022460 [Dallia pectoralis]|uniref:Uncharacterized protein n=1 Tax=Dallia pectoralis TaxID=75939 RepID=A0ACC2HGH5_DALPE|nr:hypothetical protein DPEC_G00022460 [Dallia pectoralis]
MSPHAKSNLFEDGYFSMSKVVPLDTTSTSSYQPACISVYLLHLTPPPPHPTSLPVSLFHLTPPPPHPTILRQLISPPLPPLVCLHQHPCLVIPVMGNSPAYYFHHLIITCIE